MSYLRSKIVTDISSHILLLKFKLKRMKRGKNCHKRTILSFMLSRKIASKTWASTCFYSLNHFYSRKKANFTALLLFILLPNCIITALVAIYSCKLFVKSMRIFHTVYTLVVTRNIWPILLSKIWLLSNLAKLTN